VAEMSRSLAKTLGVNLVVTNEGSLGTSLIGNLTSISSFSGGPDGGSLNLDISETVNSLVHIAGGTWSLTTFIDALQDDGLVSILAEPTLVTLSGQTANFWAGGEFPVPVPQGLGTVGIEFKQFGVLLSFTPTVLSDQRINMQVTPEVSEIDFTTSVRIGGTQVPGLSNRRVSSVIELADGQSFAIAGLLRDTYREAIARFPILGDIPILGALFRSSSYQKNQTELIVIVTPHLVKPLDMARQTLPTDQFIAPSDTEFFLYGLMQGRTKTNPYNPFYSGEKVRMEGDFGHTIP